MSVRPTDHVDVSAVDAQTRAYVLGLFVEDYRRPDQIAGLTDLSVPAVKTLLDIYGGSAHRDRLRVSLEELRATAPEPVEAEAPVEPETPTRRAGKWQPGPDGQYACPGCDRTFPTPQGVGRHHAAAHPAPDEAPTEETDVPAPEQPLEPEPAAAEPAPEAPIDEEEDTAVTVPASPEEPPVVSEPVTLDETQQRRVLAISEARRVLEQKRGGSVFSHPGSELDVPVTDLLRVACWIEAGEVLPEYSDDARSSMTTRNVQTLLKAQADLIALGYERGHARAMVDRLVDRLAELDRIQAREAS